MWNLSTQIVNFSLSATNLLSKNLEIYGIMRLLFAVFLSLIACLPAFGEEFMVVMAYKPVGEKYLNAVVLPDSFPTRKECNVHLLDVYASKDSYELKKSGLSLFVSEMDGSGDVYRSWFCTGVIK